jgi:dsRNA-specific ribonuclease
MATSECLLVSDNNSSQILLKDYVHNLYNVCAKQHWGDPVKQGCSSSGPEENTIWTCQVYGTCTLDFQHRRDTLSWVVKGTPYTGSSTSKKKAYEEAAKKALYDLNSKYPDAVPDEYL